MEEAMINFIKPLGFQWETLNPFLFCVHHLDEYPRGNDVMGPEASLEGRNIGQDFTVKDGWRMYHGQRVPGFPAHPHSGFETVTIVKEGYVDHADSLGAAGRFGGGDVQWMTAGKGIMHSEMFPLIHTDKENTMELFQIWLNLPAGSKPANPNFKMFWSELQPVLNFKDDKGKATEITIVAGDFNDTKALSPPPDSWAANPNNHVAIWNIKMEANAQLILPIASSGLNRVIYFFRGNEIEIEGQKISNYNSVGLNPEMETVITNGDSEAHILLLQGRPIGEPVAQYGPFVMNSQEGIRETIQEYNRSQFGGWPWPSQEQVHDRKLGRFARHADGKEEFK